MKGADHHVLKHLVERVEHRRLISETATTTMAALGLIAFGIMLVPILGNTPKKASVATMETPAATVPNPYGGMTLLARSAVVYDLTTGKTLFEKDAQTQLPLASLTKLLTTYAAVTTLDANTLVSISDNALAQEGDSGFTAGETFAFKDLARFALVASSNDAAAAIAETAARREAVSGRQLLAGAAAAAGLTQTYALNGTGLDESTTVSGGYGSALDIAVLAGELLQKAPLIARATVEPSVTVTDTPPRTPT